MTNSIKLDLDVTENFKRDQKRSKKIKRDQKIQNTSTGATPEACRGGGGGLSREEIQWQQ